MTGRVLVVTTVHHPLDARIHRRQIGTMLAAGWTVTQAAPWSAFDVDPPSLDGLVPRDLPRASARDRSRATTAARRLIRELGGEVGLVVLHDPELLLAAAFLRSRPPTVWDVHEDTAAALTDKPWLPESTRPAVRSIVALAERLAERRFHLLLAEEGYRERFSRRHPVIPNYPPFPEEVPLPGDERVVYVGRLSRGRGFATLLAVAEELAPEIAVELIGVPDPEVEEELRRAAEAGVVRWRGFLPNDEALRRVEGALAGLSLLRDEPNYRVSTPTKVLEYLAHGVPVVTTPLPHVEALVRDHRCGLVVGFDDPGSVVEAVRTLRRDPDRRLDMGRRGRELARQRSWQTVAPRFLALLEGWMGDGLRRGRR